MPAVRSMLARVQRLEQATVSPWLNLLGPLDKFEAAVRDGIVEGRYDPLDMPLVVVCVRRWEREWP